MAANLYAALKDSDSDSDDEDSVFRSDKEKIEKKANNLFAQTFMQNQTFSFSTEASKQNSVAGSKNQKESSLSSMANVLDSLGDDIKNIARKEREHVVKKRWNFNGLSNIVHDEEKQHSTQINVNDKYNPLLSTTINNHEKNVNNLMQAIRSNSKVVNNSSKSTAKSKKNSKMFRSRAANKRKARMLAKGEANADKNKHKIGRKKGKFGVNKLRRKMKNAPY